MAAFAVPEFRTAQSNYSETASRVLQVLSSYRDIETDLAVKILNDEVLFARLKDTQKTDEEVARLIDEAVFADNAKLASELADRDSQVADLKLRAHEAQARVEATAQEAEATKLEAKKALEEIRETTSKLGAQERNLADEAEARKRVEEALHRERALRKELEQQEISARRLAERTAKRLEHAKALACALVSTAGVGLVLFGPLWFHWHVVTKFSDHLGQRFLLAVSWSGFVYILFKFKHWKAVLGAVVISALISFIQTL